MVVLANSVEKVRALEFALGGNPPRGGATKSLAELKAHVRRRFEHQRELSAKLNPLFENASAPFRQLVQADKEATKNLDATRLVFERRRKKQPRKAAFANVEPSMITGSGIWIKVPPYDQPFESANGNDTDVQVDVNSGWYHVYVGGHGGSATGSAGLGIWFLATEDNPQQRVAAFVQYGYGWGDQSHFVTAHSNGATNIWVWGNTENQWVVQQGGLFPSWSDGTGWLDTHTSPSFPNLDYGSESLQAFFPASANNWYLSWVWSDVWCDDGPPLSIGTGEQDITVPFVVFGSL